MNTSVVLDKNKISVANSTSYVDFLGLYAGLSRFPGETSDQFAYRIQRAVNLNLSSNYEGLLNQINLRLGLQPVETDAGERFHREVHPLVRCSGFGSDEHSRVGSDSHQNGGFRRFLAV